MLTKVSQKLARVTSGLVHNASKIKYSGRMAPLSPSHNQIVEDLKNEGVAVTSIEALSLNLTQEFQKEISRLLEDLNNASSVPPADTSDGFWNTFDPIGKAKIALDYPHLFLWGIDEQMLNIAENYLGVPTYYQGPNVRVEILDGRQTGSRLWHFDGDDEDVVRVIIYLHDVNHENGPFEYIPKYLTPSKRAFKDCYRVTDQEMATVIPTSQWKAVPGPAGTVIMAATTKIFHHARIPSANRITMGLGYTSRHPDLTSFDANDFREGVGLLKSPLSKRQKQSIWEYENWVSKTRKPEYTLNKPKELR